MQGLTIEEKFAIIRDVIRVNRPIRCWVAKHVATRRRR